MKCMIKTISQNSKNVLVIMYGETADWVDYEKILDANIKVECIRWLDEENISIIKNKLTNYNS